MQSVKSHISDEIQKSQKTETLERMPSVMPEYWYSTADVKGSNEFSLNSHFLDKVQEGLAVASIARDVVV